MQKTYSRLVDETRQLIKEIFPWDVEEMMQGDNPPLIVDIREPYEWDQAHVEDSIHAPRGILEGCCDWDYDDTIPELVQARDRDVVVVCRSGNRSVFAAHTMQLMGYEKVSSMATGLRGWNDYELPLVDKDGKAVSVDEGDEIFASVVRDDQLDPARRA